MIKFVGTYCFQLKVEAEDIDEAYEKLEEKLIDIAESMGTEFMANLKPDLIERVEYENNNNCGPRTQA